MNKYEPEMLMMFLGTLKNCVLIVTCGVTVLGLYSMSRSWWSLVALLMLFFLSSAKFVRD
ncbi:hypothetical protein ACR2R6_12910 [Methylocaldum gracile subsp. desertum]|uniref:hypothetical protein n=1 Tax=Methylocaldum sp. GT1BW TaxID=3438964 RepID=UPI003DA0008B